MSNSTFKDRLFERSESSKNGVKHKLYVEVNVRGKRRMDRQSIDNMDNDYISVFNGNIYMPYFTLSWHEESSFWLFVRSSLLLNFL